MDANFFSMKKLFTNYFHFFFFLPDIQEFYEVTIQEKEKKSTEPIKAAEPCPPVKNVTSETRTSKVSMKTFFCSLVCSF